MHVTLTPREILVPATVGLYRNLSAISDKRDRQGHPDYGAWEDHIRGAIGEYVVNKLLGTFWSGSVGIITDRDAGAYQVRSTPYDGGCLIVKPEDDASHRFILVTGDKLEWVVRGWILGADAQRATWWRERGPKVRRAAWFVPQESLHPFGELRKAEPSA